MVNSSLPTTWLYRYGGVGLVGLAARRLNIQRIFPAIVIVHENENKDENDRIFSGKIVVGVHNIHQ